MTHFRQNLLLHASPAAVYAALTTKEGLRGWWSQDCDGQSHPGGVLAFRFGPHRKEMRIERMEADQQRQIAQNEALKALRAEGVACPRCNGHNALPATGVQATCTFCGATILLSGLVGEDAVARERLGRGVREAIDEARRLQEASDRRRSFLILGALALLAAIVLGGATVVSAIGALLAALR